MSLNQSIYPKITAWATAFILGGSIFSSTSIFAQETPTVQLDETQLADTPDESTQDADDTSAETTSDMSPFDEHGALSVSGTHLVDEHGANFQLQGVSTHGLSWYSEYASEDTFRTLRDDWDVNTIRLAMYTAETNGYCTGDDANREYLKTLIYNSVQTASELGMYVIIDWHILSDNDPNISKTQAMEFFDAMSEMCSSYENVLYEICNEPNGSADWASIKSYAADVIPVIRANDPDSIIIVGTPTWSQDVDLASADPIEGANLMYSLHFYADTHRDELRAKAQTALNNGLPIIVTEFGTCDSSGNGAVNVEESDKWLDFLDQNEISYVIWSLSNKSESSSLLMNTCTKTSDWDYDTDLSDSGRWYHDRLSEASILNVKSEAVLSNSAASEVTGATTAASVTEHSSSSAVRELWNSTTSCTVESFLDSQWTSNSLTYSKYVIYIKNPTDSDVTSWKLALTWSDVVTEQNIWNCQLSGSGEFRQAIPMDYNKTVPAGGEVELGMILTSASNCRLIDITLE